MIVLDTPSPMWITEKKISLWNIDTGERKHSVRCEMKTFKSVRLSPDSKILVTKSSNENIHLWDISTGEQKAAITEKIGNLRFSPDSKTLVGLTRSEIYFWDIETGKFRKHWKYLTAFLMPNPLFLVAIVDYFSL